MPLSLEDLIQRAEITDVLTAYAQAQDQNAWDLYDRVFTPDAVLEFPGTGVGTVSASEFRDFLRDRFNPTRISGQHALSNILITLDGESARAVTEVSSLTLQTTAEEGRLKRIRGNSLYVDDFVHLADGWRIRHRITLQKNIESDEVAYAPELIAAIREANAKRWL